MKEQLKARARALGFDDCRVTTAASPASAERFQAWLQGQRHGEMQWLQKNAFKRVDPQQVLQDAQSIVTLAVSYHSDKFQGALALLQNQKNRLVSPGSGQPPSADSVGQIARYAQYADYHDLLAQPLRALTEFVDQSATPKPRSLWYVDTGPFLERDLAQRAGLGFVGKHTNLISRRLGNWFFLAEIITTARIEPDASEKNRCGSCVRCMTACPTNAIAAPFELDARRCISYLTIELKGSIPPELRPAIGDRIYGCDDCLAACPWNRFAQEAALLKPHFRENLTQPRLLDLLAMDDAAFKRIFAGSPILRTKRRGFLRNVCVALGNIGDGSALAALERATADAEPLIREHAEWAIAQIRARRAKC